MNDKMKNVFEPSEKVQKMYEAIAEFLEENRDITAVTVSDITSRAGIGKGTAYEYFSSKEEIIVHATLWLSFRQIHEMVKGTEKLSCFQDKFLFILEWIRKYKEYNALILKAMKGSFHGECDKIKACVPPELANQVRDYIGMQVNGLLDQGFKEGVFTEQNIEKRMTVFFGAVMQYNFGVMNCQEFTSMGMSEEELREFCYQCMVKALN